MTEADREKTISADDQKRKIRERYKGVDPDSLDVIPAAPKIDIYEPGCTQRVAVYARVSTDDPRQTSSYELQKNYYEDMVNRNPNWDLVDIYADEGISGTSLKHRDAFIQMIEDCRQGKIDLIVTKSVSRFARNIVDCIGYVRQLAAMKPPVGVMFETERIYTLDGKSEMSLSFIATLAQEESHNKSEIMNASIEMRFKHGIFLTPKLLGYDKDADGNLVINEEEAQTVRMIFFMFLSGSKISEICSALEELGRKTKRGNTTWSSSSVLQILQNERHCGDVLARKTYTPNYLDHKAKINNKNRNQYIRRDHHEPIISRDDFIAVQKLLRHSRRGTARGFLPQPHVIRTGILTGYVLVNPVWGGFRAEDYYDASRSTGPDLPPSSADSDISVNADAGEFDLRGYEIARSEFFTGRRASMTASAVKITFTRTTVQRLDDEYYIQLLVHPFLKQIAVRTCKKESPCSIRWNRLYNEKYYPAPISGNAFLPVLFELFGWNNKYRYRISGTMIENCGHKVLIFSTSEAEAIIPKILIDRQDIMESASEKEIHAFPASWADGFGTEYYLRRTEANPDEPDADWGLTAPAVEYRTDNSAATEPAEAINIVNRLASEFKEKKS